ncbi:hypothetical protein [Belnapia rosea]|uniref:hypothetical protein n=1 Tax=Belnapia rosea TaxID=938405 RepID=UPI00088FA2D2|nr:hypothetical protein [Belnapia rosea]SDB36008.1 hypothetical protein SAMN02927895_01323 [Belnapia rosea]
MSEHLHDLDSLALMVRDPRSRAYIREAIAAYRAGAYRASVISIWVSVAFDILSKIRELSEAGDTQATTLIAEFDAATSAKDIAKQQRIERSLLDEAQNKFSLFSINDRVLLDRINEDRNLCAHPNIPDEAELFSPSAESVRSHIVHSISVLLAIEPLQGKAIISAFASDIATPAFPRDMERAVVYVRERYLARMRSKVVTNFAEIIGKATLGLGSHPWATGHETTLIPTLIAISLHSPDLWRDVLRAKLAGFIGQLPGMDVARAFRLLKAFPDIAAVLASHDRSRLETYVQQWRSGRSLDAFGAAEVPGFEKDVTTALDQADDLTKQTIFQTYPSKIFVRPAITMLGDARGWRHAESIFSNCIVPLLDQFCPDDIRPFVQAVGGNSQVWDASGIPDLLASAVDQLGAANSLGTESDWQFLRDKLSARYRDDAYSDTWKKLEHYGLKTTALSEPEED